MQTDLLLPLPVLLAAAAAFALLSAAEAVAIDLTRLRIRTDSYANLEALLRAYVSERRRLLRALRLAITAVTVIAVIAATTEAGVDVRPAAISGAIVFVVVAAIRVGVRLVARTQPEVAARTLDAPMRLVETLIAPFIALTAPVANVLRALGHTGSGEDPDPAEELIRLLEATDGEDEVLTEERRMLRGVLELSGQTVRELMTPRAEVTAVSAETSLTEVIHVIIDSGFSRIPLYDGTLDNVVGVVYAKDLLAYTRRAESAPPLRSIARRPYLVPETRRANDLLADLRRDRVHMAIALDEYGGTAGVITVEDLVEEIVGAITDEYDVVDIDVQRISDRVAVVNAGLTIDDLNDLFGSEIVPDDFDTVGGLVVTTLGRLALPGDEVVAPPFDEEHEDGDRPHLRLRVLTLAGRRVGRVHVEVVDAPTDGGETANAAAASS